MCKICAKSVLNLCQMWSEDVICSKSIEKKPCHALTSEKTLLLCKRTWSMQLKGFAKYFPWLGKSQQIMMMKENVYWTIGTKRPGKLDTESPLWSLCVGLGESKLILTPLRQCQSALRWLHKSSWCPPHHFYQSTSSHSQTAWCSLQRSQGWRKCVSKSNGRSAFRRPNSPLLGTMQDFCGL